MDFYLLIGVPGAGKGVQSRHLIEKHGLKHLSTGDIFRSEIQNNTALGQEVKRIVQSGGLVSDELTNKIVEDVLNSYLGKDIKGLILDGYPRTLAQVDVFENYLASHNLRLTKVIFLNLSDEESVKRVSGRYICSNCKKSYHRIFNNPQVDDVCDECGGREFFQRQDDKEEKVRKRLILYHNQNNPVLDFYREKGIVVEINGKQSVQDVSLEIDQKVFG